MVGDSRRNDLRRTVERGDVALGVLDAVFSPSLVELLGDLGFDFVWLDFEHGGPSPWDGERLEDLLRAADASGTELLVRVPSPDPAMVRKVLDAGVRNVFVSRIETPAEVERVVEAGRFATDEGAGTRGLAAPRASRWGLEMDTYPEVEDEEVVIGVTIETLEAVENIDAILDVPDLGFVFVGPNDLSVAVGEPGNRAHPDVTAAVEEVRTAALDRDVPLGNLSFGVEDALEKAAQGYQILHVGSTTGALSAHFKSWQAEFEERRG
ncbi:MAG: HpcH/HpaI aldolase/citrate lyase family protein [Halodesulfurarchaeum sp.]